MKLDEIKDEIWNSSLATMQIWATRYVPSELHIFEMGMYKDLVGYFVRKYSIDLESVSDEKELIQEILLNMEQDYK